MVTATGTLLALTTCPDGETAERIARTLVEERLAACVNILPGAVSLYRWQGKIERDGEWLLLIKTGRARFGALRGRLRELHPYELPELVAVPIETGDAAYLEWLEENIAPE
ncbi:MAG: divalent-cation tolerance protein CutA [Gammaproteobacteria bacterium]|nr:MAG: divalent-cation tolerance protein CutA [Gammaproteobacteria bacterium]